MFRVFFSLFWMMFGLVERCMQQSSSSLFRHSRKKTFIVFSLNNNNNQKNRFNIWNESQATTKFFFAWFFFVRLVYPLYIKTTEKTKEKKDSPISFFTFLFCYNAPYTHNVFHLISFSSNFLSLSFLFLLLLLNLGYNFDDDDDVIVKRIHTHTHTKRSFYSDYSRFVSSFRFVFFVSSFSFPFRFFFVLFFVFNNSPTHDTQCVCLIFLFSFFSNEMKTIIIIELREPSKFQIEETLQSVFYFY